MKFVIIVALLAAVPLCSAFAEDEQKSCPKPGTAMTIDIGGTIVAGNSSGLLCHYIGTDSKEHARWGLVLDANNDTMMGEGKDAIPKLWPLAVGKTVHFVARRSTASWDEDYTVDRMDTVTIGGAPHETYVVTQKEEGDLYAHGAQYRAEFVYYIDAKFGYIVKYTHHEECGRCTPSAARDWVATSITPP